MKTNEAESGSWIFREEPRVQILTCFAVLSFRSADTGIESEVIRSGLS